MKKTIKMKQLILSLIALMVIISCDSDDGNGNDIPNPVEDPSGDPDGGSDNPDSQETPNEVQLRDDATFGQVFTNSEGFTLYFFAPDSNGDSNCNGGCISAWPAFNSQALTLDDGLNTNDFGSITREDGTQQTTYKEWPLYLFASDTAAGDINGDGSGGVWFVAKPDYSIMIARGQLVGRDADGNETNLTSSYETGDGETFYMTSANGRAIYHFSNDSENTNTFTNADFSNDGVWPILKNEIVNVPSIFDMADFGTIEVFGETQITYKGWPLYYFGGDENRGDNFGVGFPIAGVWPILNPDTSQAPENAEPAVISFDVTNQGASAYVFNGEGFDNVLNPDLTLKRGETYEFNTNVPGHPFYIKSEQTTGTGDTYDNGVTNNGTSSDTITFTVPNEAPNTLYYICEFHSSMTGTLTIED